MKGFIVSQTPNLVGLDLLTDASHNGKVSITYNQPKYVAGTSVLAECQLDNVAYGTLFSQMNLDVITLDPNSAICAKLSEIVAL